MAKQYEEFGKDIGVSLALIFIGASNAAKINPGQAQVMESMAKGSTYQDMSNLSTAARAQWVDYLYDISQEDNVVNQALTSVPNYNNMINLQIIPVTPQGQEQYINLINLMSQQQ